MRPLFIVLLSPSSPCLLFHFLSFKSFFISYSHRKYIERNLLEKSVKRPFCCTVSILQVYFTFLCYITCWALEYHFIENLKLFDQLSFHIDSMTFTLQMKIFRYNYKSNDVFIHLIHYQVYLTV